ncbi:MAG: ATP-binding cassette domain-containing protein [Candidatus Omnitrophica bacterium]|nr:ATP-binding cassette domain-containing protein [Candidatus Omnitrophota bacterium]
MIKIKVKKALVSSRGPFQINIDMNIPGKDLVTLFGPSGSGKTTILRMIAGLTVPDEGLITVDDEVWFDSDKKINRSVQERQISVVFQDYNLFPNMTVRENLRYALQDKKDEGLINEFLEIVHLSGLADRLPATLSGGQQQRVALIRAFLRRPKLFLLDEPLSALDFEMRLKLQDEIQALHERFMIPTVFVTHDLGEIFKLSQRIFVLEEGKISRSGKPGEVFGEDMLSGKFKFVGNILTLEKEDFIYIVTVQIGNNITKVVATEDEARDWRVGDRVLVSAKAFNPIIMKV